jgi:hypothetical protein
VPPWVQAPSADVCVARSPSQIRTRNTRSGSLEILRAMRRASLVFVALIALLPNPAQAAEPAKPTFAAIVEKPSYQLTRCALSCAARDIVGPSISSLVVGLRRAPSSAGITPRKPRLVLQSGQDDDVRVWNAAFSDGPDPRLTVGGVDGTPPGRYSGSLIADVTRDGAAFAIPIGLDVRYGPEGPLTVLILSVLAGALLGWVLDQRPKVQFKRSADELRARIVGLPAGEREILLPLWTGSGMSEATHRRPRSSPRSRRAPTRSPAAVTRRTTRSAHARRRR